jgi:hypothetical protein
MWRNAVCATAVLAVAFGAATAEELMVRIKKIEDGKITVERFDREKEKFEQKTVPLADNIKVLNATFNRGAKKVEAGAPLPGGLKNKRLQNIASRGVRAQIVTNAAGQVAEIRVAATEEFIGRITKVEDGQITFSSKPDKSAEKFEVKTLPLAPGVKVFNAKVNREEKKIEPGEPLQGGLKSDRLRLPPERGVGALVVTNADGQVTEILVFPSGRNPAGKKKEPKE